jgi:hypothetical protein
MTNLKAKTVNTEGLESEDLKKTNHFLYDERTRGIYYTQFKRNRMWGGNMKLTGLVWEILGAL